MDENIKQFVGDSGKAWSVDLDQPVGRPGGFGAVFVGAGDEGQRVAVKVVTKGLGLDTQLLRRESDVVRKLAAAGQGLPHVVENFDTFEDDTHFCVVMELCDGSLADALSDAPMDEDEAIAILRAIADGAGALHAVGVIHRDIKPENILRRAQDWKITDFGISRDQSVGTQSRTFVGGGTPAYMPPEAWMGLSPSVRSDVYAIGCVGYRLLAGRLPYPGPAPDDFRQQHCEGSLAPLPESVRPSTRSLVTRMLAKTPAERPQDCRAVAERLSRIGAPTDALGQRLLSLAAEHDRERAEADSAQAQERAAARRLAELRRQADADLSELLEDAQAGLSSSLPDATLREDRGGGWVIECEHAALRLTPWDMQPGQVWNSRSPDSAVRAVAVEGLNRRRTTCVILANLVCEEVDGRYHWREYRFRMSAVARYSFGPHDRAHGFERNVFMDQRKFMGRPVMHVWSLALSDAAPTTLISLFAEAMELPPKVLGEA